ncbi:LOW QUALITY PROTEIN: J domain-containing protein-like [Liolophura sinensis]|uniref:LOW QUALITY PROTEIN: J domain-containing protein-like n=1 Tax=Liolophura sinensis TaxID=3198878 RepID=UPI0031593118
MDSILNYERSGRMIFYAILGCDERSTIEQINAEYKMRVLHCHPDKHPGDQAAAGRFERLQRAKCVLSDPDERQKYDMWRRAGICMSYRQWRGLRDNVHMSMHWGCQETDGPNA